MNEYIIYAIRNPNGKVYIGQTNNIERRLKQHKDPSSGCIKLRNSIQYYGWENHSVEILNDNLTKEEADAYEKFFILNWKTIKYGLNLREGGANGKLSEDTKQKISKANRGINNPFYGKIHSESTRQLISEKTRGEKSVWFGRKHSEETKEKLSLANKNKKFSEETKQKLSESNSKNNPIRIFQNIRTGEIIQTQNIKQFSKERNLEKSGISKLATRKRQISQGWIYLGEQ